MKNDRSDDKPTPATGNTKEADGSVTRWFRGLERGEESVVFYLFRRFFKRISGFARQQLGDVPRRDMDEEDIAQTVFFRLCREARAGRCEIQGRDDIWRLLSVMTRNRVFDAKRYALRQKRRDDQGGVQVPLEAVAGSVGAAQPDTISQIEVESLLGLLSSESLRVVARGKLDGMTNEEIAAEMGLSPRSVERKLRVIREEWRDYVESFG